MKSKYPVSRRDFIRLSSMATAGALFLPLGTSFSDKAPAPMMRPFGRMKNKVTTLGLGGQASIQWTADDIDPVKIITKAFDLGINYYDTSNVYDLSQMHYHSAFEKMNLIPGKSNYDKKLRESITITSKTLMRWGKPGWKEVENVRNKSNGEDVQTAADDIRRTMTQLFGDGKGYYPEGSYVDIVMVHALQAIEENDILYKGIETPIKPDENFGALVVLRDFRDGTNLTGTNPKNEKLLKHIGFSGHNNPEAMIDFMQRDKYGLLDALLVSVNSNDHLYFNMKHNVIPLAKAKGIGVIGMKVFGAGTMYKEVPGFSRKPSQIYRKVGSAELPSSDLIEYVLTTPGVDTLIIGIGKIDEDPLKCQLTQNYYASQVKPDAMSKERRLEIEAKTAKAAGERTNFFQLDKIDMTGPRDLKQEVVNGRTKLTWQTAYAAENPISHYEIVSNGNILGTVKHQPQVLKDKPFTFEIEQSNADGFKVYTVDEKGNKA
ncbi:MULTISPECIES: aldo/keto reductase [Winogradskyella]|uniref:aldo/keto reductase n=1 Tax=Winogradskyella TaxID=286104 RepID=UPI0015CBEE81|nr:MULTISPECIES: aldo/keto reductase [Winogradskyella]QXP78521.1 aldo/keto reductase [Winogradskyella sp. HaHa_3_26]